MLDWCTPMQEGLQAATSFGSLAPFCQSAFVGRRLNSQSRPHPSFPRGRGRSKRGGGGERTAAATGLSLCYFSRYGGGGGGGGGGSLLRSPSTVCGLERKIRRFIQYATAQPGGGEYILRLPLLPQIEWMCKSSWSRYKFHTGL